MQTQLSYRLKRNYVLNISGRLKYFNSPQLLNINYIGELFLYALQNVGLFSIYLKAFSMESQFPFKMEAVLKIYQHLVIREHN